jgi:Flp pilus assembly protein TadB
MVQRTLEALAYAASGPALAFVLSLVDAGLPVVVPAGFTLVGAVAAWTGAARRVARRAEAAREEMRYALVAYLQQVSLLRRGGAGVATALTRPAQYLDQSWAMRQIATQLEIAERSGLMPWDGLRRLALEIDLPELEDLSSIAKTAGHDGGAVIETLLARAESLNDELRSDAHADANRASGQMSTPGAIQVFLIAAWVLFPATTVLLTT